MHLEVATLTMAIKHEATMILLRFLLQKYVADIILSIFELPINTFNVPGNKCNFEELIISIENV